MLKVDLDRREVTIVENGTTSTYQLDSKEAFERISAVWLRSGWEAKYSYTFTWFGRPIIQLPEDLVRTQEVIYRLQPDVIVETGIAHGGSLIFYASLCEAMHHGRVVGIDVEIRPHNRAAIEAHPLFDRITLIEGSSTDEQIVTRARSTIKSGETVLVLLDSNHSKAHVLRELELYSELVTVGSYLVATDGIMKDLVGAPRAAPDWGLNNPYEAAREFLKNHPNFREEKPPWAFDESLGLSQNITYWPSGWLLRTR